MEAVVGSLADVAGARGIEAVDRVRGGELGRGGGRGDAGVAAAEEQVSEIDVGEPGAARQAARMLASLAAMRDAAQRALVRL